MRQKISFVRGMAWLWIFLSCCSAPGVPVQGSTSAVRKLHFIQDDAQDYMVSKIYTLKYAQANDLIPFVSALWYNTRISRPL